ncbi:GNAT family N-acetyltransferase [Alloiococcus sp. CFN-8]|uniref:GNAT family N-acetyltransferase n=1 Tax=Alloiococcus sp. CFN-8 TaxID=3416081 RepID=UPI003CEF3495
MIVNYNQILEENNVLQGPRIILRPFTLKDTDDVFEFASDPIVTKFLTWDTITTKDMAKNIIENIYMKRKGIYAIELKEGNKCVGCIDIRFDSYNNKASFGYVLNKGYWNKGYMTEAVEMILALSFNKLKVDRVEACHYVGNDGSGRVMEKCGMHYEGTCQGRDLIKGKILDEKHYAILAHEYLTLEYNL